MTRVGERSQRRRSVKDAGQLQQRWGVWGHMNEQYSALRSNVSMLGKVLGETIKDALGEHILDRVETIRKLSKSSRAGNEANRRGAAHHATKFV